MSLKEAFEGREYKIKNLFTFDDELDAFLFSLGCYKGEPITVVSRKKNSCVVSIMIILTIKIQNGYWKY